MTEWISVEDSLPDEDIEVLKYVKNFKGYNSFIKIGCFGEDWHNTNTTHWMPLPNPPEE